MAKLNKKEISEENEIIKNLLILLLLNNGISPKAISVATGIPEKTIRNRFPMNLIKGSN